MQRSRSPFIACAVIATIGVCRPFVLSHARDLRGRLEPVHLRHLHVHEDQRERAGRRVPEHLEHLLPGRRHLDLVAALFEQPHAEHLVDRVVLGQQDARAGPALAEHLFRRQAAALVGRARNAHRPDDRVEKLRLRDRLDRYAPTPNWLQRAASLRMPTNVSVMIVAPANPRSSWTLFAMANPSRTGMFASTMTRPNGVPAFLASFIMSRAVRPPSANRRFIRHPFSMSASSRRLVALSSATRTGTSSR